MCQIVGAERCEQASRRTYIHVLHPPKILGSDALAKQCIVSAVSRTAQLCRKPAQRYLVGAFLSHRNIKRFHFHRARSIHNLLVKMFSTLARTALVASRSAVPVVRVNVLVARDFAEFTGKQFLSRIRDQACLHRVRRALYSQEASVAV
jgi:hypothetical protein